MEEQQAAVGAMTGAAPSHQALADRPPLSRVETDSDTALCSSGMPSEAESDSEAAASEVRKLRRELEREKHKNSQLQAQLKRQTRLQGQLVTRLPSLSSPRALLAAEHALPVPASLSRSNCKRSRRRSTLRTS